MSFRLQGICISSLLSQLPSHQVACLYLEIKNEFKKRLENFKNESVKKFEMQFGNVFKFTDLSLNPEDQSVKLMFCFGIDQLLLIKMLDSLNVDIYYSTDLAKLNVVIHYDEMVNWLQMYPGISETTSIQLYEYVREMYSEFRKIYAIILTVSDFNE